jgi:hypothetical protein
MILQLGGNLQPLYYNYDLRPILHPYIMRCLGGKKVMGASRPLSLCTTFYVYGNVQGKAERWAWMGR